MFMGGDDKEEKVTDVTVSATSEEEVVKAVEEKT